MIDLYMLISCCNKCLCNDAKRRQYDFEDVTCQKNVRAEPLSGLTTPKAMVLLSVQKVRMYLFTTVSLLAKAIVRFPKVRRLNLLPNAVTKAGRHPKYQAWPPRPNNLADSIVQHRHAQRAMAR